MKDRRQFLNRFVMNCRLGVSNCKKKVASISGIIVNCLGKKIITHAMSINFETPNIPTEG